MGEADAMAGREHEFLVDYRPTARVEILGVIGIDGSDEYHPGSRLSIPPVHNAGLVVLDIRAWLYKGSLVIF